MFRYFIAYLFGSEGGGMGFGNTEIERSSPILDSDDWRQVEEMLEASADIKAGERVCVINWKRLP